ncbi:MOSC domain-containing protein YiiM [Spirosomataceae bacterium TFI 002]|nr:MOSC domain-containing protein YiiM [Spirosomataceae bacterium TFI 002]
MQNFPQSGKVEWVSFRTETRGEVTVPNEINLDAENGIEGDHYKGKNHKRQVTLIQAEHIAAAASFLGINTIDPVLLRRNIVVSGINLLALKDARFQIGEAILEFTGLCHPCTRMEQNLGEGGYNAMRGHGGITCRIVEGGEVRVGDEVNFIA